MTKNGDFKQLKEILKHKSDLTVSFEETEIKLNINNKTITLSKWGLWFIEERKPCVE